VSASGNTAASVRGFAACITDVNDWMSANRLRVNATETRVMWLGSSQQVRQTDVVDIPVMSTQVKVIIDSQLTVFFSSDIYDQLSIS